MAKKYDYVAIDTLISSSQNYKEFKEKLLKKYGDSFFKKSEATLRNRFYAQKPSNKGKVKTASKKTFKQVEPKTEQKTDAVTDEDPFNTELEDDLGESRHSKLDAQIVTPENIRPESGQVLSEGEDVKKSYNKMLRDMKPTESVMVTAADSDSYSSSSSDSSNQSKSTSRKSSSTPPTTDQNQGLTINYGHALAYALKGINNTLLFPERPLTPDNDAMIDGIAQDVRTRRFKDLENEDPDADLKMMLIAEGIVVVERLDLLPKKIKDVSNFIRELINPVSAPVVQNDADKTSERQSQSVSAENTTNRTEDDSKRVEVSEPTLDMSQFSPGLRSYIENLTSSGGRVSPNFVTNSAWDYDMLMKRNILRNRGDTWPD